MKLLRFLPFGVALLAGGWMLALPVQAQAPASADFPGVQKALTPEQYSATGLSKLTPQERANLDDDLRAYFSGATQKVVEEARQVAAAQAVDQAVKAHKAEPPQLIEAHIAGHLTGWKPDYVFTLDNGQRWKVVDNSTNHITPVDNADVFIVKDFLGYKMAIPGGGTVRVRRVN